jgi:hypothetical protein
MMNQFNNIINHFTSYKQNSQNLTISYLCQSAMAFLSGRTNSWFPLNAAL